MPVVGYLDGGALETEASNVAAFRKGLSETGFVDGRNVTIDFRFARTANASLAELATDLVRRRVDVIAASGLSPAFAAKAATATIPIVFRAGSDPVQYGLVASFNRPGGNITGLNDFSRDLDAKRLALLRDLVPGASRFAMLVDPTSPASESEIADVRAAAAAIGRSIEFVPASNDREIEMAFATMAQKHIDALLVSTASALFINRRAKLVTLAIDHRLPALYPARDSATIGGLVSYGPDIGDQHRQVGTYVGRILRGEKPADLPIVRPTKFELVINLKTAKALGLTIPETLLATADEVIE